MKSQLFLLALLLCTTTLFGMEEDFVTKQIKQGRRSDSTRIMSNTRPKPVDEKSIDQVKLSVMIEKSLPWAVALLISFASVLLNLKIAKQLQEPNNKKMQLQIENIELNLQNQLDKSLELQIQHLRTIIASNNKQEWLEEVNVCIANYLTNIAFVQPKVKGLLEPGDVVKYIEKVLLYKSKIEILLTGETYSQQAILKAMNDFNEILTMGQQEFRDDLFEEKRNKLLKATRILYKNYQ